MAALLPPTRKGTWLSMMAAAASGGSGMAALIPPGEIFILTDETQWGARLANRHSLPFLERDGQYSGPPVDDQTALREPECLRQAEPAAWF